MYTVNPIWESINALDLNFLKGKIQEDPMSNGWTEEDADRAIQSFKRFFYLAGMNDDSVGVVPTKAIDCVWHAFILHTKAYERTCRDLFGRFVHHDPSDSSKEDKALLKEGFENTKTRYESIFLEPYGSLPALCQCSQGSCLGKCSNIETIGISATK